MLYWWSALYYLKLLSLNKEVVFNMPGGDRTGPQGLGPLTGRRLGYCSGNNVPRSMGFSRGFGGGPGRGYGRGRGWGRGYYGDFNRGYGWGYQYPMTITSEEQNQNLENEKNFLETRLKEVQAELEKKQSTQNS